jgi:hypothetical protein
MLTLQRCTSSIVIINAQNVEYYMTAKRKNAKNDSIMIYVLHVIMHISFIRKPRLYRRDM